jgi:hypothetical protein
MMSFWNRHAAAEAATSPSLSVRPDRLRFRLRSGTTICHLDTSASEEMYQVIVPERRIQIDTNVREVLEFLSCARRRSELVEFLKALAPDEDPEARADGLLRDLGKQGVVVQVDERDRELQVDAAARTGRRKNPLTFHLRLLSREQIAPFSSGLKGLFAPGLAAILLALITLILVVFLILDQAVGYHYIAYRPPLTGAAWFLVVFSVYGSLLIHELGHCSACEWLGVEHGEIGVGVFFIYPVFYADVGNCWSLPRPRRAVVDAGGIYFQFLLAAIGALIWIWTGGRLARVFVYSMFLCALFNANPFLRMDGYWLLADLLGIPNLYTASNEIVTYIFKWTGQHVTRKPRTVEQPDTLKRSHWISVLLILYSAGTVTFFCVFGFKIATRLIPTILRRLPLDVMLIWQYCSRHEFSARLGQALLASFSLSVALLGSLRFLIRMAGRLWRSGLPRRAARLAYRALVGLIAAPGVRNAPE